MKKLLFVWLFFISCSGEIFSQGIFIEDQEFENYLLNRPDINLDGNSYIDSYEAWQFADTIDLRGVSAWYGLTGIEHFANLVGLICPDNNVLMWTIDLSANVELRYLDCSQTSFDTLDLSHNINLEYFKMSNHYIRYFDFSLNENLKSVHLETMHSLKGVKIATNNNLMDLKIYECWELDTLDLTNAFQLEYLKIYECWELDTLDLTNAFQLKYLDMEQYSVKHNIDFTNCYNLEHVRFAHSIANIPFEILDLSNCPITYIQLFNNEFTYVNLKNNYNQHLTMASLHTNYHLACVEVDDRISFLTSWSDYLDNVTSVNCSEIVHIPDSNFKNLLLNEHELNINYDDEIQLSEAQWFYPYNNWSIHGRSKNIHDLTGLESLWYLKFAELDSNQITQMPALPPNLQYLSCTHNQINYLPVLPASLTALKINDNQLLSLPNLPKTMRHFLVHNNPLLSCLPFLPDSLTNSPNYSLDFNNTAVTCIPNLPQYITAYSPTLPLCGSGSPCETQANASGKIYHDINNNNVFDSADSLLSGWMVNNTLGYSSATITSGQYHILLDSGVVNTIVLQKKIPYCTVFPASYQITPPNNYSVGDTFNFGVKFIANRRDLSTNVAASVARAGFTQTANILINNLGTLPVSNASLKIIVPQGFTPFLANTNYVQSGDTLTLNNLSFSLFQSSNYYIHWFLATNISLGTPYVIHAWVEGFLDNNGSNNHFYFYDTVRASFDPNDKWVSSNQLDASMLGNPLHFNVRFQNTGNDTAFTVMVRDTLSEFLDLSTFKITGSSHPYVFTIRDQTLLEVVFYNILLPDSHVNEPQSHGFVTYSVKPKSGILPGDQINNTAHIFFDFNSPVVTNTTTTNMLNQCQLQAPQAFQVSICKNQKTTLTVSGGVFYAWYNVPLGGSILSTANSYTTPNLTSSTTYYVENIANGCTSTRTPMTVTVINPSNPAISNTNICIGNSANLTATNGTNYVWYDAVSGGTVLSNASNFITPILSNTTTYYVENIENGCTSARTAVTVNVHPIPSMPTASGTTICAGNATSILASGGTNYVWYDTSSGGTVLSNAANFTTPNLTTNTTYYVENIENGCTSARTAVTINVNPSPSLPTASGTTICAGKATSILVSGGANYVWYDAASGGTVLSNATNFTTPILSNTTTYYVENIENGCTSARTAVTVNVNPIPSMPTASGTAICSGSVTSILASGGTNYVWYDAVTGGTVLSNAANFTTPNLTTNTTYYVENIENGCTSARTQVEVTVNPNPIANISQNVNILHASPNTGVESYLWFLNGSLISGSIYDTLQATQNGNYQVIVTNGFGCSDTSSAFNFILTSIAQEKGFEIFVYPNPFENEFTIQVQESAETRYELLDLLGKELKSGSFTGNEQTISMQNFSKGTYILRVFSGSKAQGFRLVKN